MILHNCAHKVAADPKMMPIFFQKRQHTEDLVCHLCQPIVSVIGKFKGEKPFIKVEAAD